MELLETLFLFNNTKLLRGVIITIIINTIGFGIIQYYYTKGNIINYDNIPGNVTSFGWHIAIGAFIFWYRHGYSWWLCIRDTYENR